MNNPGETLDTALARTPSGQSSYQYGGRDPRGTGSRVSTAIAGSIHGVPFLLKDLRANMKGTVTSNGSRLYGDAFTDADNEIVRMIGSMKLAAGIKHQMLVGEFGRSRADEVRRKRASPSLRQFLNCGGPYKMDRGRQRRHRHHRPHRHGRDSDHLGLISHGRNSRHQVFGYRRPRSAAGL